MKWPTIEAPGKAIITLTEYNTYGIRWTDFEAMENRGGWSGPYDTAEAAREGARVWITHWDLPDGAVLIEDETMPLETAIFETVDAS